LDAAIERKERDGVVEVKVVETKGALGRARRIPLFCTW
jgi:hypothetical protein